MSRRRVGLGDASASETRRHRTCVGIGDASASETRRHRRIRRQQRDSPTTERNAPTTERNAPTTGRNAPTTAELIRDSSTPDLALHYRSSLKSRVAGGAGSAVDVPWRSLHSRHDLGDDDDTLRQRASGLGGDGGDASRSRRRFLHPDGASFIPTALPSSRRRFLHLDGTRLISLTATLRQRACERDQ